MRSRSAWLTACSTALAVALAGCGGSDGETDTQVAGPTIERATAQQLADLSDEIGRSLDAGDPCAASLAAARLREDVTAAINDGKVPTVYLEDLSGLTNEIVAQIPECVEPAPSEDEGEDEDRGKKQKKEKDKKHDDDDGSSEAGETGTLPTETETTPTTVDTTTETTETTTTATTTATPEEGR